MTFAFDRAAEKGDVALMKLGSSLATDSRQNLLCAYELSVREAKLHLEANPPDAHAALVAGLSEDDG